MESKLPLRWNLKPPTSSQYDDRIVEKEESEEVIEESVEATAQSKPAQRPRDSQEPCVRIPKVPEGHRNGGRDAYEPSIISIGPYHHGKTRLLPMELLKWQCLQRVRENIICTRTLEECLMELDPMGMEARTCYSENTDNINGKDFLEMMMLDACFIIEYCACIEKNTLSELLDGRIWMDTAIRNDLLLLENQIPFFIVMKVFSIFKLGDPDLLMDLVKCFCTHVSPINVTMSSSYLSLVGGQLQDHLGSKHLLHFYRRFLFYRAANTSLNTALPYAEKPICTIRSATFLEEAGIKLEKFSYKKETFLEEAGIELGKVSYKEQKFLEEAGIDLGYIPYEERKSLETRIKLELQVDSAMNVTFQNGVMKITPLFIDAYTVSQFRNLIALEKHDSSLEPQATAFAQFMDYIISTSKDVDLLRKKGILDHSLGSDEEIATIFNQLTSGILEYRTPQLEKMYKDVDKYCKTKRHLWRAILMKDYFGSPWTAISLVAAVILLSLTFIQTFFSMYSYFRPPSAK